MSEPLLSVENVWITFSTGTVPAVRGVTYSVNAGEVLAVVGESGAGKTVTALSLLGLLPRGATVTGRALLRDRDLLTLSPPELRSVRGNDIGMIFQEPMSALNPVLTIGSQITEAIRTHQPVSAATARRRATELLDLVRLPDARQRLRAYPHELSGGQLQRIVIAMAIANDPALIIADEPTTALDVTVQAGILELLRDLRTQLDTAILLITHDMGVVADLADRVVVMRDGHVVEQGDVGRVFTEPQEDYTKQLLGAVISLGHSATLGVERALHDNLHTDTETHIAVEEHPATRSVPDTATTDPILHLDNLSVTYGGRLRPITVHAVDTVSLHVDPGEILGLVGESGSGKTTIANAATGLLTPTHGVVRVSGTDLRRASRALRRHIGLIFQDPLSSLNPRATVAASIAEPIRLHRTLRGPAVDNRVNDLLETVALPADLRTRYPHELSGGQRQRVCIARALALNPDLLIADEPTSALDVSVQARILDLLRTLQREHGFACLFISHDLAVIEQLADRVAVMHRGHIVETGPTAAVLSNPLHPYTQRLLAAAPVADPIEQARRRDAWRRLNVE